MRAAFLSLLLAFSVYAQEADSDIPFADPVPVPAVAPQPPRTVCIDGATAIAAAKRIKSCEASMAVVETKTVLSTPLLVGGMVAVFVLGMAAGVATAMAARK